MQQLIYLDNLFDDSLGDRVMLLATLGFLNWLSKFEDSFEVYLKQKDVSVGNREKFSDSEVDSRCFLLFNVF